MPTDWNFVAVNGSPSGSSKTHAIASRAIEIAGSGVLVDLGTLDAAALLAREPAADVTAALAALENASALLLATPIYRGTYSGLLKAFLDLLPPRGLQSKACILTAVGGSPLHSLTPDVAMRPLIASVDGWSVPTSLYATSEDFTADGQLGERGTLVLEQAIAEARHVSGMIHA